MLSSTSRALASGLGVVLVAAALAACNSGYGNPYTSATATPTTAASPTPTPVSGQTTQTTFTAAGGTLMLGPYANAAGTKVSLTSSTWGAITNQTSVQFQGSFAAGSTDLNPPNASWVAYNLGGSVVIYLSFVAMPAATFAASPALTFTASAAVTGSACTIASFANGAWTTLLSGGALSNGNTTITFATQMPAGGFAIGNLGSTNGPAYYALVCS